MSAAGGGAVPSPIVCAQQRQLQLQQRPPRLYPSISSDLRADELPESRLGAVVCASSELEPDHELLRQPSSNTSTESAASASTALQPDSEPESQTRSRQQQMRTRLTPSEKRTTATATASPTPSIAFTSSSERHRWSTQSAVDALEQQQQQMRAATNQAYCASESSQYGPLSDPPSLEQVSSAEANDADVSGCWFDDSSFHYLGPVLRIQFKKLDPSLALVCSSSLSFLLGLRKRFIRYLYLFNMHAHLAICILSHEKSNE